MPRHTTWTSWDRPWWGAQLAAPTLSRMLLRGETSQPAIPAQFPFPEDFPQRHSGTRFPVYCRAGNPTAALHREPGAGETSRQRPGLRAATEPSGGGPRAPPRGPVTAPWQGGPGPWQGRAGQGAVCVASGKKRCHKILRGQREQLSAPRWRPVPCVTRCFSPSRTSWLQYFWIWSSYSDGNTRTQRSRSWQLVLMLSLHIFFPPKGGSRRTANEEAAPVTCCSASRGL